MFARVVIREGQALALRGPRVLVFAVIREGQALALRGPEMFVLANRSGDVCGFHRAFSSAI